MLIAASAHRSRRLRAVRTFAPAARCAVLGAATLVLVACGGKATVDNSDDAAPSLSAVPNVTGSAKPGASGSNEPEDEAAQGAASGDKSQNHSDNSAHRGGPPLPVDDGSVAQVDRVPVKAHRSGQDKEFLAAIRKAGVDLGKLKDGAEAGGFEDQIIAAAQGYCQVKDTPLPDIFIPMLAGQLHAQKIITIDPKDAEKFLRSAAESAYCPS